jgi:predicted RNA-binding protein associated with RNAse of E/G family
MTQMLYKYPGKTQLEDGFYECQVFDESEVEQAINDGWYTIWTEAKKATQAVEEVVKIDDNAPPTTKELRAKAVELGIEFSKKTTDDELFKLITEKMGA